jgi:glycosyltransferase involved in cell wall biosynthesis
MMARPRVLMLTQSLPYPPQSGVANRTLNVLRQLRLEYDVDLVPFSRVNHQPDRAARDTAWRALQDVTSSVAEPTPIPNEHSAVRKIWDHLRAVASGRAYTYYEYQSRAFADRLHAVLQRRRPDLVHFDSLDLYRWLPDLPPVPIACTHHNLESELLRLYTIGLKPALLRRYVRMQADRVEGVERRFCPRLAVNVMVSDVDARRLRAIAPGAATVVVPNGTDTDYFQPTGAAPVAGRVAFVGPTYSHPNRDAVEFLLQDIWPRVRTMDGSATLHLVGRGADLDQARYAAEPGVSPLGHVHDVRPAVAAAACCVVPIRIGGGTRLKILDAWAMGKAVVSTSIGCEGLDAVDGENILVRDTPDAFACAVIEVLRDATLRSRLERNARQTAIETYSWSVVGQRLRAAYDVLLGRVHRAPLRKPTTMAMP